MGTSGFLKLCGLFTTLVPPSKVITYMGVPMGHGLYEREVPIPFFPCGNILNYLLVTYIGSTMIIWGGPWIIQAPRWSSH